MDNNLLSKKYKIKLFKNKDYNLKESIEIIELKNITYTRPLIMCTNKKLKNNKVINANVGLIPYKSYNTSIIRLSSNEFKLVTNNKYNILEDVILFNFFVAPHGYRYGSMNWVGVASFKKLSALSDNNKIDNNFWIIEPHLLQNDLGPKYADPRIFIMKHDNLIKLGYIGYTRVAPISNTENITDYYVRASIINTREKIIDETKNVNKYNFGINDIGCFPSNIGHNYESFISDDKLTQNLEFYIENNSSSKYIFPHKSKDVLLPESLKLNGIEISFSTEDSNENPETHISTKNIVPLQHINYLNNIGCFIDFNFNNKSDPKLTIMNMCTANVLYNCNIIVNNKYTSKFYCGSTPVIELCNNIWIALVHKTFSNPIKYEYYFVFFNTQNIHKDNININIPYECIFEIKIDITEIITNGYIYITGLIIEQVIELENNLKVDTIISYGILDNYSSLSKISLIIPKIY